MEREINHKLCDEFKNGDVYLEYNRLGKNSKYYAELVLILKTTFPHDCTPGGSAIFYTATADGRRWNGQNHKPSKGRLLTIEDFFITDSNVHNYQIY